MLSTFRVCSRCLGRLPRTVARLNACSLSTSRAPPPAALLSSTLLTRAQAIAAEHTRLSAQNAENYDVVAAKKIGDLGPVTEALKNWQDAQESIHELELLLQDPHSDSELLNLAQTDLTQAHSTLPQLGSNLKRTLIPPHPFAALPCLIEIHPGAGGSEAALFASELLKMYTALAARKGWTLELVSHEEAPDVSGSGLTSAVLEISTPGTYDLLRAEAGVHRVQRVPATEKKGRTHTSAVSVLVLPSLPTTGSGDSALNFEDPSSDYYISPDSVRSETMRASGAGGQHVNKTDSAIRLTHIPTGLVVAMQESRSQHKNREKAWQVLRAKLAQRRREEREEEMVALRRKVMGGVARTGREDKVRTYNFSQNRVTDHRAGSETGNLDGLLGGGEELEEMMARVREWMQEQEVLALAAEAEIENGGRS